MEESDDPWKSLTREGTILASKNLHEEREEGTSGSYQVYVKLAALI